MGTDGHTRFQKTGSGNTASGSERRLQVQSGGLNIAVRCWGDPQRPTMVFVHGYPDNNAVWQRVIECLAGPYHLVAYDVRGAGGSDAPSGTRGYRLPCLVGDLAAVIDAVSPEQPVHLVAHDWGSIQCWEAVTDEKLQPRIRSYTTLSGPCLDHVGQWLGARLKRPTPANLRAALGQLIRSWYVYVFHLPLLPELMWRAYLGRAWPRLVRRAEGMEIPPSPTQVRDGVNGMRLYRANFRRRLSHPERRFTRVPVQLIVATQDAYVSPRLYDDLDQWVPQLRRREVDTGHWLPLKRPDWLAQQIDEFARLTDPGSQTEQAQSQG